MNEKDKLNDKKKINVCARETSMNKNNNNNNNYQNIDDDTTIKNVCAKFMEGELFIII